MSHPALDRRNCHARTIAILDGHSVLCAEVGADPACPGPEPAVSAVAGEEPPLIVTRVRFRPDDGFPICDGYMVGPDDDKAGLYPTPEKAIAAHRRAAAPGAT